MTGIKLFTIDGNMERVPALTMMLVDGKVVFSDVNNEGMKKRLEAGVEYKDRENKPEDGVVFLEAILKVLGSRIRADVIE